MGPINHTCNTQHGDHIKAVLHTHPPITAIVALTPATSIYTILCRTKPPTGTAALLPQSKCHASVPCKLGSWAVCRSRLLIATIGKIYAVQFRLTNSLDLTINITLSMVGIRNGFRTLLLLLLDDLYLLATQKTVRMITNSFFVNLWNAQYLTLGMCFILGPK